MISDSMVVALLVLGLAIPVNLIGATVLLEACCRLMRRRCTSLHGTVASSSAVIAAIFSDCAVGLRTDMWLALPFIVVMLVGLTVGVVHVLASPAVRTNED
jgi:hypothetical protein